MGDDTCYDCICFGYNAVRDDVECRLNLDIVKKRHYCLYDKYGDIFEVAVSKCAEKFPCKYHMKGDAFIALINSMKA